MSFSNRAFQRTVVFWTKSKSFCDFYFYLKK